MLGHLLYGWLLYETITSETNLWIRVFFATILVFWLISVVGLLVFATKFWQKKGHEKTEEGDSSVLDIDCFFSEEE